MKKDIEGQEVMWDVGDPVQVKRHEHKRIWEQCAAGLRRFALGQLYASEMASEPLKTGRWHRLDDVAHWCSFGWWDDLLPTGQYKRHSHPLNVEAHHVRAWARAAGWPTRDSEVFVPKAE